MVTTDDQGPFGGVHQTQTDGAPVTEAIRHGGTGGTGGTVPPGTGPDEQTPGGRTRTVLVPVLVGVVAALVAAGVTFAVLRPGAEDARDERDAVTVQLA